MRVNHLSPGESTHWPLFHPKEPAKQGNSFIHVQWKFEDFPGILFLDNVTPIVSMQPGSYLLMFLRTSFTFQFSS